MRLLLGEHMYIGQNPTYKHQCYSCRVQIFDRGQQVFSTHQDCQTCVVTWRRERIHVWVMTWQEVVFKYWSCVGGKQGGWRTVPWPVCTPYIPYNHHRGLGWISCAVCWEGQGLKSAGRYHVRYINDVCVKKVLKTVNPRLSGIMRQKIALKD